jgi:two-component system response regulator YesN
MKLLIVDDERLTREGLVTALDWPELNIDHIYLAKDGHQGLALARKYQPELILTDVRMPKMDGIKMAEQLRLILPDSSIIFISGFSDKQYLKAAIKLRAINYVEKPIDAGEIKAAITEAIQNNKALQSLKHSQLVHSIEQSKTLALDLTYPAKFTEQDWQRRCHEMGLFTNEQTCFTTLIAQTKLSLDELSTKPLALINRKLTTFLSNYNLELIHVSKTGHYHIYHIWDTKRDCHKVLLHIAEYLKQLLSQISPCFISIGTTQCGLKNVCSSYAAAVIRLQQSFFYEYNTILFDSEPPVCQHILVDPIPEFEELLAEKNKIKLKALTHSIYEMYCFNKTLLPSIVKDVYYQLFMHIERAVYRQQLSPQESPLQQESLLNTIASCCTLIELQAVLEQKMDFLFQAMDYISPENSTIYLVKDFISKNYMNDSLSVKSISEHVFISSSYICTMFKTETGKTLNQYITEYRIEKAKQLLTNPRYRITDISAKVGYSDGNYFGKTFKKNVGISPSEYREKKLIC